MKRKTIISRVTRENASPEVLKAMEAHEAKGYRITNMKETLLHNVTAFESLESGTYAVDEELQKHIPKRALQFFGYAVSNGNKCLICGNYFKKIVVDNGVTDFEHFEFTDEEKDLLAFADALVADPNNVPDSVYEKLQARYDEETLVLLVTNAVLTLANNYFNNIVGTEIDDYLLPYLN